MASCARSKRRNGGTWHACVRGDIGVDWNDYTRSKDNRDEYWRLSTCARDTGNRFVPGPQTPQATIGQNNGQHNRSSALTDAPVPDTCGVPDDVSRNKHHSGDSLTLPSPKGYREYPLHVAAGYNCFRLIIWSGAQVVHGQKQVNFLLYVPITRTKRWVIAENDCDRISKSVQAIRKAAGIL